MTTLEIRVRSRFSQAMLSDGDGSGSGYVASHRARRMSKTADPKRKAARKAQRRARSITRQKIG